MNQIIVLYPNGDVTPITQKEIPTLKQVQDWVKGYVEPVSIDPNFGHEMYVNEEGLLEGLPENRFASLVARQPIVGNAVVFVNSYWE